MFCISRKVNILPEEKLRAVFEYQNGYGSLESIAKKYGVNQTSFRKWIGKYKAFLRTGRNVRYGVEFKQTVINDYLTRGASYQ